MNVSSSEIKTILKENKKITVIGLSRDGNKPAQKVPQYMRMNGFDIVGVHPSEKEIAGFKCYPSLTEVPAEYLNFVDVFRPSQDVPAVVDSILEVGKTKIVWLQMGITHPEAEKKAEAAGLQVVSDLCLHLELEKLLKS